MYFSPVLQAKGKSVKSTGSNRQNQVTTDEVNQPDSMHKLATGEGTLCVSGLEMVTDETLQSSRRPSIQQDPSALNQLTQNKAMLPSRSLQLPQNIISELNTVLNKTGRSSKEAN